MAAELLTLGIGIVLVFPLWRVFERAGIPAPIALLAFLGFPGLWIAATVLAFGRWSAVEGEAQAGPSP